VEEDFILRGKVLMMPLFVDAGYGSVRAIPNRLTISSAIAFSNSETSSDVGM
jgi:hypothetical protein